MDEKNKELAGLLGMIAGGGGVVGSLIGGGSLISNALGANRAIDERYQRRIMDGTRKVSVSSLNPQQKAAVKRLTGMDVSAFPGYTTISNLPITINNRQYTLGEIIFDKTMGITAKLPKDAGGLKIREAINQLVVPIQQEVLEQAKDKVKRRQVIKDVASQQVAAGGAIPQVNKQTGGINMVGGGSSASALRQGALGSTAPTSSLITNEGFEQGPRTTFNEIAQRLPAGHPSATTGSRMPIGESTPLNFFDPPMGRSTRVQSQVNYQGQDPGMATQSNNFTGPETFPERQAAYRETVKSLKPQRLGKLLPKIVVPGTGIQTVKNVARNVARGVVRSPLSAKLGAAALPAGLAVKGAIDNYAADQMVEDVVKQTGQQPPAQSGGRPAQPAGMAPPTAIQTQVMDMFDSKYAHMSKQDKINEARRITSKPGQSGSAMAALWLKYNAPAK
jgi:hypothetical protein